MRFISTIDERRDIGMLIRVLGSYAAWLIMVFGNIPTYPSVFIIIAAPMFFGSVIFHLWKTHSMSFVNRVSFSGAIAFFPFLAIQILAMRIFS
jgi:hypothetical protein